VIPRNAERILPPNEDSDSDNWWVLEYLAFEANSLLDRIAGYELFSCSSLQSSFIPASVRYFKGLGVIDAEISMIFVDPANEHLIAIDFYLMDFNRVSILRYFGSESDPTLDAAIQILGAASFGRCESLSSLMFESGSRLKEIDAWAFAGCSSLQTICIPESTEVIGRNCFDRCTSLSSVTFESSSRLN
jgi:hypothetical protein